MHPSDPQAVVRRYVAEILNGTSLRSAQELFAENVTFHDPALSEDIHQHKEIHGVASVMAFFEQIHDTFDTYFTIEDLFSDGRWVAMRWSGAFTQRARFMGKSPTGETVTVSGVDILDVEDGKIREVWVRFDSLTFLQELGIIPSPQYFFTTIWRVEASLAVVWRAIAEVEKWPTWWRGVQSVRKLRDGDRNGIGTVYRETWRSLLPYDLVFDMQMTRIEPGVVLEGRARGDLEGTGTWQFSRREGYTVARCDWTVQTTEPWMTLIEPVARPVFQWNHRVVMDWGAESLSYHLNAPVHVLRAG